MSIAEKLREANPSGKIWGLLNGYSSEVRGRKPLAFFEAYFDDSSSDEGDKRLFIAGYLNSAENWALFSDAWQECLDDNPKLKYLKMSEAKALQGQFRGWTPEARDAKLRRLSFIVRHFAPLSFEFSVSRKAYLENLADFAPRGLNPHFYCIFGMVSAVSRFLASRGAVEPVRFYFDQQDGVDTDIALFFDYMRSQQPRVARKLIAGLPVFLDDTDVLPIQAADFLAWHIRREHEGRNFDDEILSRLRDEHVLARLEDHHLIKWRKEFSELPGLERMQSKGEWQRVRAFVAKGRQAGYLPPYGTRWLNFRGKIRNWIKDKRRSLSRRWRR